MCHALLALALLGQMFPSVVCLPQTAEGKIDKNRGWHAATYRGLTIGSSTFADMINVLGKPHSSGPSADQKPPYPIIWHDYGRVEGELPGHLAVEVDKRNNRIVSISISPENMSKDDAIKYFGNDYLAMDYGSCQGIPMDWTAGPVYENPRSGKISYLEYRSRGIAVHLDYRGKVGAIYYVDEPLGLASEKDCEMELTNENR